MSRARALLVAANDDFLQSVTDWLANDPQVGVVGRAHAGSEALAQVEALSPELVLVDVTLPDINGFELARQIKSRADAPFVVLVSFFDSQVLRLEAWSAGADGVVPKSEMTNRLKPLVADLLGRRGVKGRKQESVQRESPVPPHEVSE